VSPEPWPDCDTSSEPIDVTADILAIIGWTQEQLDAAFMPQGEDDNGRDSGLVPEGH
jgi:hypothetical protein